MKTKTHLFASISSTLCIFSFFISTIFVELFASSESIGFVKQMIVTPGLYILIPAIGITGITGFILSRNRKGALVNLKRRRMPIIGINGLVFLVPAALYLNHLADTGSFGILFYLIQVLELLIGAINLSLMGMNIRDGLRMTGKLPFKKGN